MVWACEIPEAELDALLASSGTSPEMRRVVDACLKVSRTNRGNNLHHIKHHRRRDRAVAILRDGLAAPLPPERMREALEHLLGRHDAPDVDPVYPGPDDTDLRAPAVLD